jgi:hypothetical protein
MREKYRKADKDFNFKTNFDFADLCSEDWKSLENLEKQLKKFIARYRSMLKNHNVYQIPPEIKEIRTKLQRQLKVDTEDFNRIKWYHRNKTKYRNFFKRRVERSKKYLQFINVTLAKAKKKFNARLKRNPNYFKEKYEYAIEMLKQKLKKIEKLKTKVLKSSKKEGEIIIHMYKKLLEDLQRGSPKPPHKH